MGLHPLPDVELYWSTDPFYHNSVISAVMTCRRFKKITENLHLIDRARELQQTQVGYDRLVADVKLMKTVMEDLVSKWSWSCAEQCRLTP
ncbi:unnamed protein product [Euphydryas editha]|uniref:PiggyBac transposable element-derived protein domain-containing protein n=1 Tax=Euphydryas editha TaxID=104508 RepID=A0AAU9UY45_EUPED|nr:unnamed protein product [Euphydryas editha]